jgi:hypothetical protein
LPLSFLNEWGRSDRHVGEHPGAGHEAFFADLKGRLSFEDVRASASSESIAVPEYQPWTDRRPPINNKGYFR